MKKTSIGLFIAGAIVGTACPSSAQTPPPTKNLFVDVNFGAQPASQIFEIASTPVVYGENAIVSSTQGVDGSALIDLTVGYRVWGNVSVALALTTTVATQGEASVTGAIPHPIFFDRRVESTTGVTDLEHKERSAHLSVMWTSPITDKIDGSVMAGPTYIKVFQALVTGVQVTTGTQNFTPVSDQTTATVTGFHFGGEVTYLLTRNVGIGGMLRYVAAKVDLGPVLDVKAGGFQYGGGLRLRF